jgi:hypothetical protein
MVGEFAGVQLPNFPKTLEIEWLDQRVVVHPRLLDPLRVPLRRRERLFLRSKPKRCITRHVVGTLTRRPIVSATRVHNSSSAMLWSGEPGGTRYVASIST